MFHVCSGQILTSQKRSILNSYFDPKTKMVPISDQIRAWKLITDLGNSLTKNLNLNLFCAYIYMFVCVCVCCITGRCGPCNGKAVREWFQPDHNLSLRGAQPQLQKHVQAQTSAGEMAEWRRYNTFFTTVPLIILWKGGYKTTES